MSTISFQPQYIKSAYIADKQAPPDGITGFKPIFRGGRRDLYGKITILCCESIAVFSSIKGKHQFPPAFKEHVVGTFPHKKKNVLWIMELIIKKGKLTRVFAGFKLLHYGKYISGAGMNYHVGYAVWFIEISDMPVIKYSIIICNHT